MCGLVGYYGVQNYKNEIVVKDLLRIDVVRGPHSTGLLCVDLVKDEHVVVKDVKLPDDFFDTDSFIDATIKDQNLYMGHNRFATKGAITSLNAHPFEFDNVIGAHNGTLKGQWRLPDSHYFDVDSENLFYSINEKGIEDTWKIMDGAAAITWWDKKNKTFNIARNNERTLYYCYTEDNKGMYYASEAWMLKAALGRNNVKHGKIYDVPTDEHMIFKINKHTTVKKHKKDQITSTKYKVSMEKKKLEPYVPFVYGGRRWLDGLETETGIDKAIEDITTIKEDSSTDIIIPPIPLILIPGKEYDLKPLNLVEMRNTLAGIEPHKYINCHAIGNEKLLVRIPLITKEDENRLGKLVHREGVTFRARIYSEEKSTNSNFRYWTASPTFVIATVKKFEYDDDKGKELRQVFEGKLSTREEFDIAYLNCSNCGDPLMFEDKDIDFIDDKNAICGECSKTLEDDNPELYSMLKAGVM